MTYRDDRDADRARITALEAELASARRRVDELEGRRSEALVLASTTALAPRGGGALARLPWYGAPLRLELTRTFDGEFPRAELESLIERIRAIARDPGRTELLTSSLTWSSSSSERTAGPFTVVTVLIKGGTTTLTATERLGPLAGAYYGGVGGGAGGGTLAIPIGLSLGVAGMPLLIPFAVTAWLGAAFFGARRLFRRAARRRAEALQQLFDALGAEIEAALARPGP